MSMHIAIESPDQPEVTALIARLDAYQVSLYPPESNHLIDLAALRRPEVLFAVARDAAGRACGCGALRLMSGYGEVKRVYVATEQRGLGVGAALLGFLEGQAGAGGCRVFRLETGVHQREALALYRRAGNVRRGPFAHYPEDPLSVFMEKRVGDAAEPGAP